MKDICLAKDALGSHSIAVVRAGSVLTDDARGISPMLDFLARGEDLRGAAVADRIVGRAAALLFLHAGIRAVWATVISRGALALLMGAGVSCRYDTLTEHIINRTGDDICPMEKTVVGISDPETAYRLLREKRDEMRRSRP